MYEYDTAYKQVNELTANKGYWIKCNKDGSVKLNYTTKLPDTIEIQLKEGWNLIGTSIKGTINKNDIVDKNTLFKYENSYKSVPELAPNKGYWIKASKSGKIILKKNVSGKKV